MYGLEGLYEHNYYNNYTTRSYCRKEIAASIGTC
jgi:hypothetical protein